MSKITKTPIKVKEHFSTHALQASNYTIRTETYEGRPHLVVPVIMMVEGVHNGSHGPILHTIEELGKFPGAWNGIPHDIAFGRNKHLELRGDEAIPIIFTREEKTD